MKINQEILNRYTEYGRFYHNYNHIRNMLFKSIGSGNLVEKAIIYHDAIYDSNGNNEERSANLIYDYEKDLSNDALKEIHEAILATKDHLTKGRSETAKELIMLDLNDLTDPDKTKRNWYLLREEASTLLGMSYRTFYMKNIEFLSGLHERMGQNMVTEFANDKKVNFFRDVIIGIQQSINLSFEAYNRKDF